MAETIESGVPNVSPRGRGVEIERDFLDLSGNVSDSRLAAFKAMWAGRRQGTALPLAADFGPEDFAGYKEMLTIIDYGGNPARFVFRQAGSALPGIAAERLAGRDVIHESGEGNAAAMLRLLTASIDTRRPVRLFGRLVDNGRPFNFEWLNLPLRDESGHIVTTLLLAHYDPVP